MRLSHELGWYSFCRDWDQLWVLLLPLEGSMWEITRFLWTFQFVWTFYLICLQTSMFEQQNANKILDQGHNCHNVGGGSNQQSGRVPFVVPTKHYFMGIIGHTKHACIHACQTSIIIPFFPYTDDFFFSNVHWWVMTPPSRMYSFQTTDWIISEENIVDFGNFVPMYEWLLFKNLNCNSNNKPSIHTQCGPTRWTV